MGELGGFLKYRRKEPDHRPVAERVKDFNEIELTLDQQQLVQQAARCMNCGIPFCHGAGCPVGNLIPDFNDLVHQGRWQQACDLLHSTNNFPEITGRICPAPCEAACTLEVNDEPVLIRHIELQIVERGFREGWIRPQPAKRRSGRRVVVIGSGPGGLAAAQQLARAGHSVLVIEQDARPGGMLRYGIPDFKLPKWVIDRRLDQLRQEGVEFQTSVKAGEDVSIRYLRQRFDAMCLAVGARQPRDLDVPGRGLEGIVFALDFLSCQNRLNAGEPFEGHQPVNAKDKTVVVIGGGDTGSDCIGTAIRQGAKKVYQLEILPEPPQTRPVDTPWPTWPRVIRTSTSHQEGAQRFWSVDTKAFEGRDGRVAEVHCCKVEWVRSGPSWQPKDVPGTGFSLKADLVILAMGFVHVMHKGLVEGLGLALDRRGNVLVDSYQSSVPWVFAAGDAVSGASLVVKAIASGRGAAEAIDNWLR